MTQTYRVLIIGFLVCCLQSSFLLAGTLTGKFKFKKKTYLVGIVYFSEDKSLASQAIVDQKNTEFTDMIVVGQKGKKILFKNSDIIDHNIFADDQATGVNFDIGMAAPGATVEQPITWEEGSVVRIGCRIHPEMQAWIASLSSKYYHAIESTKRKKTKKFKIENVPDQLTKIKVWVLGFEPIEVTLQKGKAIRVKVKRKKKTKGTLTLSWK